MDLVVYSQYYRTRTPDRQLEIDECLRRNLNHPGISRMVLFCESDAPPVPEGTVPVEVVSSDERITYAEWFRWVKRQGSGIGLLLNADIYLDEGLEHLTATCNGPDTFLALTRYNPGHAGFHLNDYPHWTQDVWGVRADAELPESLLYASSFPLGFPGCDNRIAYVMWSHGFRVRNPCYHVRSVHLQASSARAYDKTSDRLYGGVSYVHPSLVPDEDAELEFTLWTRSQQRPAGVLVNQQAIEQGVHQLRHGEAQVAQRFLDLQQFTGLSWVHEAVGSAHLQGELQSFASEDTVFLPLPALLEQGVELLLPRPTKLEGLTLRLPRRAPAGYQLELEAHGEGETQLHLRGEAGLALKAGGERRFWQPAELKGTPWQRLRLKLTGPSADPIWRNEEGAELVLFGEERALDQAKSLSVIAEEPQPQAEPASTPPLTTTAEPAEKDKPVYQWWRRKDCETQLAAAEELHSYGRRFRVLRSGEELLFDDRFWPSVGMSPIAAVPCGLGDAQGLLLWGFGQPALELRPGFIANTKRFSEDVNFWQYPCRTEGDAFAVHQTLVGPQLKDGVLQLYLGLPWATWIDRASWPTSTLKGMADRLRKLRLELQHFGIDLKVHSVCQHILWRENLHLIKAAGVDCLWLSHKPPADDEVEGVELRAWHLYPVNAREADRRDTLVIKPMAQRPWLASFIGAHMKHYITDVRLRLQAFKDLHRFHIQLQDEWHFNPIVYGEQVGDPGVIARKGTQLVQTDTHRYNKMLSDSQFSLCPAGAGPNSLRLWESLAVGSVPVILSDQLALPDLDELSRGQFRIWDDIVLFHPEAELDRLPERLEAMPLDELQQRSDRAIALMELVNNHSCLGAPTQRVLPELKRQTEPDTSKPTIVVPVYGPTDRWYWRAKKHGFYNVVMEWYLRGYVNITFGEKGYFWWGKPGEILLMERDLVRDLYDRKLDPPRWEGEVPYKHAFFFNQYHLENSRNHKATYFTYAPEHLEKVREKIGRLGYEQRKYASIFAGSIENETQEFFRNKFKEWEEAIEIYSCIDKLNKSESRKYSIDEYIRLVSQSRFGVCFRGNGPKCYRELEYLALGTPLIITTGVEVNYPNKLEEGTHFYRADTPQQCERIALETSRSQWEKMSKACYEWFSENGTIDSIFHQIESSISSFILDKETHSKIRILAPKESAFASLAALSLKATNPNALPVSEEYEGTCLSVSPEELIINKLPLVGDEGVDTWKIGGDEQRNYCESILNSELEIHKDLLELMGLRFRNFKVEITGPSGIIPVWERRSQNGIELMSIQEVATLTIDFNWARQCQGKYIEKRITARGPATITIPSIQAFLHYTKNGLNLIADLSPHFDEYMAIHGHTIPDHDIYRICNLWKFEDCKLVKISIDYGFANATRSPIRSNKDLPLRNALLNKELSYTCMERPPRRDHCYYFPV